MPMDLSDELEQSDSGMESLTASKDDTPERKPEDFFITPSLGSSPSAGGTPSSGGGPPISGSGQPISGSGHPISGSGQPFSGSGQPISGSGQPFSGSGQPISGPLKEYDDEPDETLSERLWGLTEMFPECVRNCTYTFTTNTLTGVKSLYGISRSVMWVVASSSVILFAPVIFEVERAQMAEMEKSQQKQVLLGTNTALSGPMPNMPPMPR